MWWHEKKKSFSLCVDMAVGGVAFCWAYCCANPPLKLLEVTPLNDW